MSDSTLVDLAKDLAMAVEITMNPEASQQQRMEAYIACEKYEFFKSFTIFHHFNENFLQVQRVIAIMCSGRFLFGHQ